MEFSIWSSYTLVPIGNNCGGKIEARAEIALFNRV